MGDQYGRNGKAVFIAIIKDGLCVTGIDNGEAPIVRYDPYIVVV